MYKKFLQISALSLACLITCGITTSKAVPPEIKPHNCVCLKDQGEPFKSQEYHSATDCKSHCPSFCHGNNYSCEAKNTVGKKSAGKDSKPSSSPRSPKGADTRSS